VNILDGLVEKGSSKVAYLLYTPSVETSTSDYALVRQVHTPRCRLDMRMQVYDALQYLSDSIRLS
jgi:hypothetical protein